MAAAPTITPPANVAAPASTPASTPQAPSSAPPSSGQQPRQSRRQPSLVQQLNAGRGMDLNSPTSTPEPTGEEIQEPAEGAPEGDEQNLAPEQTEETVQYVETDVPEAELFRIAQEDGLDPTDPADLKAIEKIFAREQRAKAQPAAAAPPPAGSEEELQALLTPFERSLLQQQAAPAAPPAQPPAAQAQPAAPPQAPPAPVAAPPAPAAYPSLPDIGQNWKGPNDGLMAELQEYGRIQEDMAAGRQPDYSRLMEVQAARSRRAILEHMPQFAQVVQSLIEQTVPKYYQDRFQEDFAPLEPVREYVQRQQLDQAQRAAVNDLAELPQFKEITSMFAVVPNSKPLKFKDPDTGETSEYPDTLMNRVMLQHPELLRIEIPADPARGIDAVKAHRLTLTARYKQAALIHFGKRPDPQAASALVKAGAQMATRLTTDQIRQQMNSSNGTPAGGAGSPNGSTKRSFVNDLVSRGGASSGISLDNLVRRK